MDEFDSITLRKASNGYVIDNHQDGTTHVFKKDNEVIKFIKELLSSGEKE